MADETSLTPDYALAIGQLVIAISKLDSVLIDVIRIFSKTDIMVAVTAFSHLQTTSKIDTLLALYRLGDTPDEVKKGDRFTAMMTEARRLCDYRNTIVHAYWAVDETGAHAVRFSARGEFKRTSVPVTAKDILDKSFEVASLEAQLRGLRDHINSQGSQRS
jgi:hypothetical protein